ncbi:MAG: ATP-binding protein [Woeseiaceae bacterium]|nr:ATP-binding protein [Woeseiaceae bacterium]
MLKADRIGLVVVLASLVSIAAIAWVVFDNQHEARIRDIRGQGVSLARALSAVPYEQLAGGGEQQGAIRVLRHSASSNDFAYVVVVDRGGETATELAADGIIVPAATMPAEPTAWMGEARLSLSGTGQDVIEFHAPLLTDGELQGFVRLGYAVPGNGINVDQLPFVAAVALPVFLLVPLFYLLLRLEVRPVREASREIGNALESGDFSKLEVAATGELGEFMRRFNSYVEHASDRIHALESEQQRLVTSSKLLTYRKNRVETVLETLPEAVMILDESGAITFANQKLAAMFNVSPEVVLAQPPQKWCDNPDILQLLSKYQGAGNSRTFTDTIRFSLDEASQRAIATRTYPLFSPKNPSEAIGTLVIFRDETQEALARQARTDFVAHLSHELKSPLNVLGLYSESLLSEAGKSEEFRIEAANVIAEEVDRLSSLITGLLSMTQIETGSLAPERSLVRLRDVAQAAFDEAVHSAKRKDLTFEFDAPREMSPVNVDKDLIRIALTNLLSNAVKYNKEGGKVRLSIAETDDAIQVRVADEGIGISEDEASKIFEKFYRSEDERVQAIGGHGLGLALARQIVELHHGSLTLDHERDEGAEFIINIWKETSAVKQAI